MRLVILESPYAGDVAGNVDYARQCMRECLLRGDSPIASHLLYTQPGVLDDLDPTERQLGIDAGLAWHEVSDATCVYVDRGITRGMAYGIQKAIQQNKSVEYRRLGDDFVQPSDPESEALIRTLVSSVNSCFENPGIAPICIQWRELLSALRFAASGLKARSHLLVSPDFALSILADQDLKHYLNIEQQVEQFISGVVGHLFNTKIVASDRLVGCSASHVVLTSSDEALPIVMVGVA